MLLIGTVLFLNKAEASEVDSYAYINYVILSCLLINRFFYTWKVQRFSEKESSRRHADFVFKETARAAPFNWKSLHCPYNVGEGKHRK